MAVARGLQNSDIEPNAQLVRRRLPSGWQNCNNSWAAITEVLATRATEVRSARLEIPPKGVADDDERETDGH